MPLKNEFKDIGALKKLLAEAEEVVLPQILTTPDTEGENPNNWLIYACSRGMTEHAQALLESPYAPQLLQASCDIHGKTALDWAVVQEHEAIALMLIARGAPLSPKIASTIYNKPGLFPAFVKQRLYLSHLLSAPEGGLTNTNWLCLAVDEGEISKVKAFLQDPFLLKALVNAKGSNGFTPLAISLAREPGKNEYNQKKLKIAEELITQAGPLLITTNLNVKPLGAEYILDSLLILNFIMLRFPNPPNFSYNLNHDDHWLTRAAWAGNNEAITIILAAKPYKDLLLNRPGENGLTALEWALAREKFGAALELMKHNPDIRSEATVKKILDSGHAELIAQYRTTPHFIARRKNELALQLQACIRTRQAEGNFKEDQKKQQTAVTTLQGALRTHFAHQRFFKVKDMAAEESRRVDTLYQEELQAAHGGEVYQLQPRFQRSAD